MAFTPLNGLYQFLAVAQRRSFAKAAADLRVSPSALSQAVRQLEARLGVALLTRTTRSVTLTEAGKNLFEHAGPAVSQAVEALKTANTPRGELTGKVRLNVPAIALSTVILPLVERFRRRHPNVEIELHVEDRLVDVVAEGFDAGVRLEEFLERDMVQVRLTRPFRFVVAGAPSYLARKGVPQRPEDLLGHECICMRSPTTRALKVWHLERGKRIWRLPAWGTLSTNDERLSIALAEAGLGLIYAFEPGLAAALKRKTLRRVLEPYAVEVPGFFLYFPSRAQVSPSFRGFLEVAREAATGAAAAAVAGQNIGAEDAQEQLGPGDP